jgi:hypothetical protein
MKPPDAVARGDGIAVCGMFCGLGHLALLLLAQE